MVRLITRGARSRIYGRVVAGRIIQIHTRTNCAPAVHSCAREAPICCSTAGAELDQAKCLIHALGLRSTFKSAHSANGDIYFIPFAFAHRSVLAACTGLIAPFVQLLSHWHCEIYNNGCSHNNTVIKLWQWKYFIKWYQANGIHVVEIICVPKLSIFITEILYYSVQHILL